MGALKDRAKDKDKILRHLCSNRNILNYDLSALPSILNIPIERFDSLCVDMNGYVKKHRLNQFNVITAENKGWDKIENEGGFLAEYKRENRKPFIKGAWDIIKILMGLIGGYFLAKVTGKH